MKTDWKEFFKTVGFALFWGTALAFFVWFVDGRITVGNLSDRIAKVEGRLARVEDSERLTVELQQVETKQRRTDIAHFREDLAQETKRRTATPRFSKGKSWDGHFVTDDGSDVHFSLPIPEQKPLIPKPGTAWNPDKEKVEVRSNCLPIRWIAGDSNRWNSATLSIRNLPKDCDWNPPSHVYELLPKDRENPRLLRDCWVFEDDPGRMLVCDMYWNTDYIIQAGKTYEIVTVSAKKR